MAERPTESTATTCDCGAAANGPWANIHLQHCAALGLVESLEGTIHAIAVKHCIALPEPVVREMVARLRSEFMLRAK